MKKSIRIFAAAVSAASMLAIGAFTASAGRTWNVWGYLDVSYHWVPVLQDTAVARTNTDWGLPTYPDTGGSIEKLFTVSTVTVISKDGRWDSNTNRATGTAAFEGWHESSATVQIRNMYSATGTHQGGQYGYGSGYTYTSWYR